MATIFELQAILKQVYRMTPKWPNGSKVYIYTSYKYNQVHVSLPLDIFELQAILKWPDVTPKCTDVTPKVPHMLQLATPESQISLLFTVLKLFLKKKLKFEISKFL